MTTSGMHYHNSLKSSGTDHEYKPSTEIINEPLSNRYTVGENIGRGKFAVVKKCVNKATNEEVAAKVIKKRRRGKSCRDEILREVVMLEMALDHPRLVNLKEVYETQSELILITEYCAGGELFTECVLEEKFNEADVRLLMQQILEGLVYLHEKFIVHLDLKPQNILLTKPFPEGTVKICDLGFACLVNTGEDIRDIIGTPDYVAPEVLNYDALGLYTDMWSLGVLTYVMLTTCSPFMGDDKQQTFCNITMVNLDFPDDLFAQISPEAQDFISKLLLADPSERLTAKECQEHSWISGVSVPSPGVSIEPGTSEVTGEGTSEVTSVLQPVSTMPHYAHEPGEKDLSLVPTSHTNSIEPGTSDLQQLPVPNSVVNCTNQETSGMVPRSIVDSIEPETSITEQFELHKRMNLEKCLQMNESLTIQKKLVLSQNSVSQPVGEGITNSPLTHPTLHQSVGDNKTLVENPPPGAIVNDGSIESPCIDVINRRQVSEMSIGDGTDVDAARNESLDLGTSVDLCTNSDSVFTPSESGTNVDQGQSDSDANFDLTSIKDSELADSGMWSKSVSEGEMTDNAMTSSLTQSEMEISKEESTYGTPGRGRYKGSYSDGDVVMEKREEKSDSIEIMDIESFNKSAVENDMKISVTKLNRSNLNNSGTSGTVSPCEAQTPGQLETWQQHDTVMSSVGTIANAVENKPDSCNIQEPVERDNRPRSSLGTINENVDTNNIYPSDSRNKRGMSNDTSPTIVSESAEEGTYEFISVSKRVRSIEETYSPIKSPQFSPKSPRSPRVGRHAQRSSHHHSSTK